MPDETLESEAQKYLDYAKDPQFTVEMARVFGNDEPAPAKKVFYDKNLKNTGTAAYYGNPEEIEELYPLHQRHLIRAILEKELGTIEPYMGLNPDLPKMQKDFARSIIKHEKSHGAQPKGKFVLKGIHAYTPFGTVPLGKMFVEGWNEYGLERKGEKPPSRYMDEMYGDGKSLYSKYRDFVYEVERKAPGITRQVIRAARRGGANAAMRLIESIPDIDKLVTKYASKINNRINYATA